MHNSYLAVLFAFASAMTIAWGTVVRHRIAQDAPGDSREAFVAALRQPMWWAGTSTALIAYGLQAVAFGFGTVLIVQPILVLKLMLTFPLEAHYARRRVGFGEMFWSGVLTAAVAILVIMGKPAAGLTHPPLNRWIPALIIGIAGFLLLDYIAKRGPQKYKALLLGVITGGIFGYVAVLSKAVVDIFLHYGPLGLVLNWEPYMLVFSATVGTVMQQFSFNAGNLKQSLPAMTIGEPIVAFTLGYLILGEKFQIEGIQYLWMGAALIAMFAAAIALSIKGAETTAEEDAEATGSDSEASPAQSTDALTPQASERSTLLESLQETAE